MNRKNAILSSLKYGVVAVVVGLLLLTAYDRQQLEETLHEKEESLTSLNQTVEKATSKIDELEKASKQNAVKVKDLEESLADTVHKSNELTTQLSEMTTQKDNLATAYKDLQTKYKSLEGQYETLKKTKAVAAQQAKKAAASQVKESQMPSRSNNQAAIKNQFYVEASAYTAYCTGCSGITATGINLRANPTMKLIAVDPRIIPLGSRVWVEGYGYAIAGDTGGAIKGYKIDIHMATKKEAYAWGRKKVLIKVF